MEVKVHDTIYLVQQWLDVGGGCSLSQIVISSDDPSLLQECRETGWTVTKYVKADEA